MDWKEESPLYVKPVSENVRINPKYRWEDRFIKYGPKSKFYIYCDTNASYVSIHQYLQNAMGKPSVVANGNAGDKGDAGACLAISYEARGEGIKRGVSLRSAKAACKDIVVFESCLPLYELYADLFDKVLEWIAHPEDIYRGSCDEVTIESRVGRYPDRDFYSVVDTCLHFIKNQTKIKVDINANRSQLDHIEKQPKRIQVLYAMCYIIRDVVKSILGLPVSISVSPSISLCKSLIERAKPEVIKGKWLYKTTHNAICFPQTAEEANKILRRMRIKDLCGIHTIATRLAQAGIHYVGEVQDYLDIEDIFKITRNKHLSDVVWYMCHGRDDVLAGYLSAIRDRK